MIYFFGAEKAEVFAVQTSQELTAEDIQKLEWLFGDQPLLSQSALADFFVGPRKTMITPWSTNAVEITQNMQIKGILRIETFKQVNEAFTDYDPMLEQKYNQLDQDIFTIDIEPAAVLEIDDIASYNQQEGLALSEDEILYLEALSEKLNRRP